MGNGRKSAHKQRERQLRVPWDFLLILLLFFTSRLMMLAAYPPEALTYLGNFPYFFQLAQLWQHGWLPYIAYWLEQPPLFPLFNLAIFSFSGGLFSNYTFLCGLFLLGIECFNLYILFLLAKSMRGEQKALNLCWAYAVLFAPTFFWLNSYEALTTFFILASLWMIRRNRIVFTALAVGLGVLTKFLAVLMLAVVWRFKGWKGLVTTGAISLGLALLIFAPFYLSSPTMTSASIVAHLNHSPSNTVWGLLQNRANLVKNPAIHDHLQASKASQPLNGPERWPIWPVYIPFAALGIYFLISPRLAPGFDEIIISTMLFSLLFLAAPDWNPHWQLFYIPLLLLAFPFRRALLHVVTLSAVNLLESPLLESRNLVRLLPLTIIARTLILVLIVIELAIILAKARRVDVKPEGAA